MTEMRMSTYFKSVLLKRVVVQQLDLSSLPLVFTTRNSGPSRVLLLSATMVCATLKMAFDSAWWCLPMARHDGILVVMPPSPLPPRPLKPQILQNTERALGRKLFPEENMVQANSAEVKYELCVTLLLWGNCRNILWVMVCRYITIIVLKYYNADITRQKSGNPWKQQKKWKPQSERWGPWFL